MLPFEGEGDGARAVGDGARDEGDGARDEAKEIVTSGAISSGVGEDMLTLIGFLLLVLRVLLMFCLLVRAQFVKLLLVGICILLLLVLLLIPWMLRLLLLLLLLLWIIYKFKQVQM